MDHLLSKEIKQLSIFGWRESIVSGPQRWIGNGKRVKPDKMGTTYHYSRVKETTENPAFYHRERGFYVQ